MTAVFAAYTRQQKVLIERREFLVWLSNDMYIYIVYTAHVFYEIMNEKGGVF